MSVGDPCVLLKTAESLCCVGVNDLLLILATYHRERWDKEYAYRVWMLLTLH